MRTNLKVKVLVKKPEVLVEPNCVNKSLQTDGQKRPDQMKTAFGFRSRGRLISGVKRKAVEGGNLECREGKRVKMDRIVAVHCREILKKLMDHKHSKVFHVPVDPVAWGILDYFDIIKHPMDLGTVKKKLEGNVYAGAEEFRADMKLTFANAMTYNPPGLWVHEFAKELDKEFDGHWKLRQSKLIKDEQKEKERSTCGSPDRIVFDAKGKQMENNSAYKCTKPAQAMSRKENGSEGLKSVPVQRQMSESRDAMDEKTKCMKPSRPILASGPGSHLGKEIHRPSVNAKRDNSSVQKRSHDQITAPVQKHSHVELTASVQRRSHDELNASVPKRSRDELNASVLKHSHDELNAVEVENTTTLQTSRSDQDSQGAVSCVDEEHSCSSNPTTDNGASASASASAVTSGLDTKLDPNLSISRALHVADMKRRYADIIHKAQNKTLMQEDGRTSSVVSHHGKDSWEQRHREDVERREAIARASELLASRREAESKKQRQEAREAARAALEKVERSVDLDDNFHTLKDLEAIIGSKGMYAPYSDLTHGHGTWTPRHEVPKVKTLMEELGLYLKEEYRVGYDDDDDDDDLILRDSEIEEGELIM